MHINVCCADRLFCCFVVCPKRRIFEGELEGLGLLVVAEEEPPDSFDGALGGADARRIAGLGKLVTACGARQSRKDTESDES